MCLSCCVRGRKGTLKVVIAFSVRELRSSSANSTSSSKLSACLTPKANEWQSEPSYGYYSGLTPDVLPRRVMRNGQLFFDHRFDPSGQAIKDGTFWPIVILFAILSRSPYSFVHFLPFLVPKVLSYDNVA